MFLILCFFIAAVFLFCLLWLLSWWNSKIMTNGLRIKFKQFLTMYRIDPNRWRLDNDGSVLYEKYYANERALHQWFYFSPIGFLRYKLFYKEKDKKKKKIKNDNRWEKIINSWQEDIDKYREKYTKELKDKIKEI